MVIDIQSVGKLNIYFFGKSFNIKFSLFINGRNRFDQVGYSSDIGDSFGNGFLIFVVGIFGMDVIGRVDFFLEKFIQGGGVVLMIIELKEVVQFIGDRMFSRFGSVVKVRLQFQVI